MIKLVAFDWNGTLFADTYAILDSINEVLKLLKFKPVNLKTFQKHFDVPVTKTFIELGMTEETIKNKTAEIIKTFHENYERRAVKVRTRAFAKQLLDWLSRRNIKSIIFSNHIDEPIRKQLKRLKIEKYFLEVLANSKLDSSLKIRTKQKKLEDYIKSNGFLATEALVIGDTVEELEIGQEIGAVTVALTDGNCSVARLKDAKPDYLISSLKEVVNIIRERNNQTILR